jgi:dihydrofolate reductase
MLKAHVSMSLDGFVAGAGIDVGRAMGQGGEALHSWLFADPQDPVDREVARAMFSVETVGAVLMGRRTLDVGLGHWGDDGTFQVPCFVVTHRAHDDIRKQTTTFTFVTDGLAEAAGRARMAAGDRHVNVMGASITRQLIVAGLIDEIHISLVPILLGDGASLLGGLPPDSLELEQLDVMTSACVTHLRYGVRR